MLRNRPRTIEFPCLSNRMFAERMESETGGKGGKDGKNAKREDRERKRSKGRYEEEEGGGTGAW